MSDNTYDWDLYEIGKNYFHEIDPDLYTTVDLNERFYSNDHWHGCASEGNPTPVFPIFKRIINYFISAIMSQAVKMQFVPENISDNSKDPQDILAKQTAEIVSAYSEVLWEDLKMDSNLRQALLDAILSGNAFTYNFFNYDTDIGQEAKGAIEFELPDNVNVFFGNPNDYRVQKQPYILISFRELVSDLREEARKYGVEESKVNMIVGDNDTQEQSGDRAKIELDTSGDNTGKTIALMKFWKDKKTGNVFYSKSTRSVKIRENVDTEYKLYPIANMFWDKRKNSYIGQALGTGIVPNQMFVNKMFAMVMLNSMHTSFPKAVYDSNIINEWNNMIGEAIAAPGGQDVSKVAAYLQPGNMSSQVMQVIEFAIKYTMDLLGVSDISLGDIKADNRSAFIAAHQVAAVPLETYKANLYQWVEDIGYIWLDMMGSKYGIRNIAVTLNGVKQVIRFDFSLIKQMRLKLKIDVGPSSAWSLVTALETLDNLLAGDKINFIQYLERVPEGVIPKKQELIEEIKADMQRQAEIEKAMQEAQMQQQQQLIGGGVV